MLGFGVGVVQTAVRGLITAGATLVTWAFSNTNQWENEVTNWEDFQ